MDENELLLNGIPFERQVIMPVDYKGNRLDCGYRVDIVVDKKVILELKSVSEVHPIHKAQLLTYLKLSGLKLGLLLNFNVLLMKDGMPSMQSELFKEFFALFASFAVGFLRYPNRSYVTNNKRKLITCNYSE